jgi:beta-galactosidase
LYDIIKRVNSFINKEKENLLLSKTKSDVCVGLYKPYFYTELTTSQMLKDKRLEVEKLGLLLDPRFIREEILFNGLLRNLQTLNFTYNIEDIETTSIEVLLKYKQLWITSTELMASETQNLLADYVKKGGHLIIYPTVPTLDLYLNPCTILKDQLDVQFTKSESPNKVEALGIEDLYTVFRNKEIFEAAKAQCIAKTEKDECCGIRKTIEKGMITAFGFAFGYTSDEHLNLVEKIVSSDKIKRQVKISDSDIQFVLRKSKNHSYLFLLNYHNEKKTFTVNNKKVTLTPFSCKVIKK